MSGQTERQSSRPRRPAKAPGAFRTISEVAEELDVPQHVLRFWEGKFTQVRPLKRGGGRRYYRPEDVDLLRRIRRLLYNEGYTIRGVQKVLKDGGARSAAPTALAAAAASSASGGEEDRRRELESVMTELATLSNMLKRRKL
jgi:DNA-binding transcriptional MerR regulator